MRRILWGILLSIGFAGSADAALFGTDSFDGNSISAINWEGPFAGGTGALTEAGGHLSYSAGGSGRSSALLGWILNRADNHSNWNVQVDVNLPNIPMSTSGQSVALEIGVIGSDDQFIVSLGQRRGAAATFRELSVEREPGNIVQNFDTSATAAALRIRFDAASQTIYGEYDGNGMTGGYSWTSLFDSHWTVGDAQLALNATSANLALSNASGVYFDNLHAVPEPSSYVLIAIGLVLTLAAARRRRPSLSS